MQCDVLVIGGGPAGCSAALQAACGKCNVLLVDRASFPRDKVCGDAITPRSVYLLAQMGVPPSKLLELGAQEISRILVHRSGHSVECYSLPVGPGLAPRAFGLARRDMDLLLWERAIAAGVSTLEKCNITAVSYRQGNDRYPILATGHYRGDEYAIKASLAIIATGSASPLGCRVGFPPANEGFGVGMRQYYRSPKTTSAYHLFYDASLGDGCCWAIPAKPHLLNVGIGITCRYRSLFSRAKGLLHTLLQNDPAFSELLEGAEPVTELLSAPILMSMRAMLVADGIILVGDAAGLVHPDGGQGISYALESGMIAGQVAAAAVHLTDVSSTGLLQYDVEIGRRLWFLRTPVRMTGVHLPKNAHQ